MRRRTPWWAYAATALILLVAGGLTAYLIWIREPADVSNPNAEFVPTETTAAPKPPRRRAETFVWPIYGYTPERTRQLDTRLDPPFRLKWRYRARHLMEFQPVLAKGTLFVVKNNGSAVALSARTGRPKWRKSVGSLNASSPAWWNDRLFIATLDGRITALDARSGRTLWKRNIPSRTESSPYVLRGRVYFGSEDGTVYALRARDGKTIWTYRAAGAVKAALAYSRGRLFFGDYAGQVTALRARDGSRIWSTGTSGRSFGRAGNFYSTPAVAFGRVYLGNTDGRIYSLTASRGELAWTRSTGAYVYAAPAVANVRGLGPTVYIGSYNGRFYALDARSGGERWSYAAGGKISGAASLIGRVVYLSNLDAKETYGLDARTGKRVFKFGHGGFNPAISDGRRLYVTGYSIQFAFEPKRRSRGRRR